jgi:DNA-binding IclR family transcriptional regulator
VSAANSVSSTPVERTFDILEYISRQPEGLTNSELSRHLRIPKSSASYILRTMERRGYVRLSSGKYKLGYRCLILGRGALAGSNLKETALPILKRLTDRTSLTANLAILDHTDVVYIEKAEAPSFIKMDTYLGRRMPAHATSVGKAILAFLPSEELDAVLKGHMLERLTPKTITSHQKLFRELEIIRRQGYAVDDEESSLHVRCVGAPVFGNSARVEAAVSVSGTTLKVDASNLRKIAMHVSEAAENISHLLGFQK